MPHSFPSQLLPSASVAELAPPLGFYQPRVLAAAPRRAPEPPAVVEALHDNVAGRVALVAAFAPDQFPRRVAALQGLAGAVVGEPGSRLLRCGVNVNAHCGPVSCSFPMGIVKRSTYMPRTRIERTVTDYQCPVAGKTVRIHRTWNILLDNTGGERTRALQRTICDNQDNCIVATHHGNSTSYDWSKCAFCKETES